MPYKLPRPCRHPGCPNLVYNGSGYCSQHAGEAYRTYNAARSDSAEAAFYRSARWRRLSTWYLARHPVCQVCGKRPAVLVHHVTPIRDGGALMAVDNLLAVCATCHQREHPRG